MHILAGHGGIRIAADSWGDPACPLVMLLHGGGQTRHAWRATGKRLAAAGYFAVACDARGHGDSDWAEDGDYRQDVMVADLKCLIDGLGGRRPVLVGASMGGGISIIAVGEDHVEASGLILVDIVPGTEPAGVARIQSFMRQSPDGFESLEEVADSISQYHPNGERRRNLQGLAKNVRLGADGRYHWHWDPLYLASTRDIRQSEYVNVLGAGHMVAGDRNDLFGYAAIDFLRRKLPVRS